MPNYFGEQRFGRRGDNAILGAALVRADNSELLMQLLGRPNPAVDNAQQIGARDAFDRRDNERAMHLWPRASGMERRVLARLMKSGRPASAIRAIDQRVRRLWISALQSQLFNEVLAARIDSLDKLMDGDLAMKHENGAGFLVESAAVEQPRCDAFEISPTGPIIGYRMSVPTGQPLAAEEAVFAAHKLKPGDFKSSGRLRVKGTRRPLRVRPENVELAAGVDEDGGYITVAFTLPAGSFATTFLRELMKNDAPVNPAAGESEAPESENGVDGENSEDQEDSAETVEDGEHEDE
jgi:tRNA pseudouridine13 synthase